MNKMDPDHEELCLARKSKGLATQVLVSSIVRHCHRGLVLLYIGGITTRIEEKL